MKKRLFFVLSAAVFGVFGGFNTTLYAADEETSAVEGAQSEVRPMKKHFKRRGKMMMEKVDTNQDGQIDLSEYLAQAEERFRKLDLDSDGFVTKEEHRQAAKEMRKKHREKRKEWLEKRRSEEEAAESE